MMTEYLSRKRRTAALAAFLAALFIMCPFGSVLAENEADTPTAAQNDAPVEAPDFSDEPDGIGNPSFGNPSDNPPAEEAPASQTPDADMTPETGEQPQTVTTGSDKKTDTTTPKTTDTNQTTQTTKTDTKKTNTTKTETKNNEPKKTEAPKAEDTKPTVTPETQQPETAAESEERPELPDGVPALHTDEPEEDTVEADVGTPDDVASAQTTDPNEVTEESSSDATSAPLAGNTAENTHGNLGLGAIIGIGAGAIILLALLIILIFKLIERRQYAGAGAATLTLELLEEDGSVAERVETYLKRRAVIGSRDSCDISIDDDSVAPRHCKLYQKDDMIYVEDMGSHVGTRVNGELIDDPVELTQGSVITLGDVSIRFLH